MSLAGELLLVLGDKLSELRLVSLTLLVMLDQQLVTHRLWGRLDQHLAIVLFGLDVSKEFGHFFLVTLVNQLLKQLCVLGLLETDS